MQKNYLNMSYFKKKDKYKKDFGMTVTVRQVKDKDGNTTSDVNGAIRVLKKKLMKEGMFQELRERTFHQTRGEKKRKQKAAGKKRWERKLQKRKQELGY